MNHWATARREKLMSAREYALSQHGRTKCGRCGQVVHRGSFKVGKEQFSKHVCEAAA